MSLCGTEKQDTEEFDFNEITFGHNKYDLQESEESENEEPKSEGSEDEDLEGKNFSKKKELKEPVSILITQKQAPSILNAKRSNVTLSHSAPSQIFAPFHKDLNKIDPLSTSIIGTFPLGSRKKSKPGY